MAYYPLRCWSRGRHRERFQGPGPRGHWRHQEGIVRALTFTIPSITKALWLKTNHLTDSFFSFSPLQPWGAPDHPVRQVHRWGGELISPSLTHVLSHQLFSIVRQFCNPSSTDDQPVGCFPPWCGWQCGLQEHLLRHHTRRREGGINPPLFQDPYLRSNPILDATSTLLTLLRCRGSLAHSRALGPLCPLASSLQKDLSPVLEILSERTGGCGVVCVWVPTGEHGIIFNKNNLVALKLSLHLCPCLLFPLLFLPSLILSFCVEANSACIMPMYSAYAYAVQCIQWPVRHISWVLWCKHSRSLETSKRPDPSGLLVSTWHRVFYGLVPLFVSGRIAQWRVGVPYYNRLPTPSL